jgi:PleD family two-component response regulator
MVKTPAKIVLVDDTTVMLLSLKDILKDHYEIFLAQSAGMLFDVLNKVTPDLIMLDIAMPGTDGFKTCKILKSNPLYANIPVIFLTGISDKKTISKGMEFEADDILFKPVTENVLIECIENQIGNVKPDTYKPVILAVDDSPTILASINHILERDYIVYTLPEPQNLKRLLSVINPDLFILDCQMPEMNGFDCAKIIKENKKYEDAPIIFLSSEGTIDHVSVAIGLGVGGFLVKPINEALLRERTAAHLKGYLIRRRMRTL